MDESAGLPPRVLHVGPGKPAGGHRPGSDHQALPAHSPGATAYLLALTEAGHYRAGRPPAPRALRPADIHRPPLIAAASGGGIGGCFYEAADAYSPARSTSTASAGAASPNQLALPTRQLKTSTALAPPALPEHQLVQDGRESPDALVGGLARYRQVQRPARAGRAAFAGQPRDLAFAQRVLLRCRAAHDRL